MLEADRIARLDTLLTATNQWADKRTQELNNKVDVLKNIMQARIGIEQLAELTLSAAEDLVNDQIDNFKSLVGGIGL
jgi:hypothetical protein